MKLYTGPVAFPCGATYPKVNARHFAASQERGKSRLLVYRDERLPDRPQSPTMADGSDAPCARCPTPEEREVITTRVDGDFIDGTFTCACRVVDPCGNLAVALGEELDLLRDAVRAVSGHGAEVFARVRLSHVRDMLRRDGWECEAGDEWDVFRHPEDEGREERFKTVLFLCTKQQMGPRWGETVQKVLTSAGAARGVAPAELLVRMLRAVRDEADGATT